MKAFADLLYKLVLTPARNRKLELLTQYLRTTPDPDRGYALAALTSHLTMKTVKSAALRDILLARVDPTLFEISYDYVGDLAETIALMWPSQAGPSHTEPSQAEGDLPSLTTIVEILTSAPKLDVLKSIQHWLDCGNETQRWALMKLITGNLRIGLSEKLAKTAVANLSDHVSIDDIEELWHGLTPPYTELFNWIDKRGDRPDASNAILFRSLMLANPLEAGDMAQITPETYAAEWKWDGIRVQLSGTGEDVKLFSRSGEDISAAFPDLLQHLNINGVLDGELLVMKDGKVAPFNDLQQRLNRKTVTPAMLKDYPVHVRLYDILFDAAEDLRPLTFMQRRARLEQFAALHQSPRLDVSTLVEFSSVEELGETQKILRERDDLLQTEGYMLKRKDSAYLAGRAKGHWWKWKRDPLTVDVVLIYAQRGHGKRSSYYSDYTFGAWDVDDEGKRVLVPVGKAYSGYTDEELLKIDKFVRNNTLARFGPVRTVKPDMVFELEFDGIFKSARHKSGVAMRFPRIARIRWDKPANEADTVENLRKMIAS